MKQKLISARVMYPVYVEILIDDTATTLEKREALYKEADYWLAWCIGSKVDKAVTDKIAQSRHLLKPLVKECSDPDSND